jgi:hypothetical protein
MVAAVVIVRIQLSPLSSKDLARRATLGGGALALLLAGFAGGYLARRAITTHVTDLPSLSLAFRCEGDGIALDPSGRPLTIFNKVTSGTEAREDSPAYLSTAPEVIGRSPRQCVRGTEIRTGSVVKPSCWTTGDRVTNGDDSDPSDDTNSILYESQIWYLVAAQNGRAGYISEAWIEPSQRGTDLLPRC